MSKRKSTNVVVEAAETDWGDFFPHRTLLNMDWTIAPGAENNLAALSASRSIAPAQARNLTASDIPPTLFSRHQDIAQRTQENGLKVLYWGTHPIYQNPLVFRMSPQLNLDFVLLPYDGDPTVDTSTGKAYMPPEKFQELESISKAGIDFDQLFIAHEVKLNSVRAGEPLPAKLVLPDVRKIREDASRIGENASNPLNFLFGSKRGRVRSPAASFATSASYSCDPIVFGVNAAPHSQQNTGLVYGTWYYLTHWIWAVED